jgi:heat shock protein HslJ
MRKSILAFFIITLVAAGCKSVQKVSALPEQPIPPIVTELQETHWKLTELMGKPVVLNVNNKKSIYLILKNDGSSVLGFSGCNTFMGKYVLSEGNRIAFSAIASTMMACPDLSVETEFNKMLGMVDSYSFDGITLSLNKARMAPLARFEVLVIK